MKSYINMYAAFPLNIVILPTEKLALHLFEDRYKELYRDHRNGKKFVIINQEHDKISQVGTLVHIDKVVHEYEDGKTDIVVVGSDIIRPTTFESNYPNRLYSAINGDIIKFQPISSEALMKEANDFFIKQSIKFQISDLNNPFKIACLMAFSDDTKKIILQFSDEAKLNLFLINEIKIIKKAIEQEGVLQGRFLLN